MPGANTLFVGGIERCCPVLSGNSLPTVQSWSLLDTVSRYLLSSSSYLLKTQAVFISVNHCWRASGVPGHTSKDAEIPVPSTTGCFCFHSIPSFFLELFFHWSPVAYWAHTDLGSSSFSVLSFCLFILLMGFSRQEY